MSAFVDIPANYSAVVHVCTQSTASLSSNFQFVFDNALKAYQKRTKKNLLAHPLVAQLQACDSPTAILVLLHQQIKELNQSQDSDEGYQNG